MASSFIVANISTGDVAEVPVPSRRRNLKSQLRAALPDLRLEAAARSDLLNVNEYVKPHSLFFQALHRAYADHHAFGIRPEVLMFLVNATVAECVNQNPDAYRELFTTNAHGKEVIRVLHDGLRPGNPDSPWNEAIALFLPELQIRVPSGILKWMLPSLSTHTDETLVSSLVTFMDAARPFYDYRVRTLCGIPRIVLFGEPEDYRKVVNSAEQLSQVFPEHLGDYFTALLPVLTKIATEAEAIYNGAQPDLAFWSQIYKHYRGSGGDSYSGWAATFVGYVMEVDDGMERDPNSTYSFDRIQVREPSLRAVLRRKFPLFDQNKPSRFDVKSGSEQTHISVVPFVWEYLDTEIPMSFIGGITAIEVEEQAITPQLSWAVARQEG